MSEKLPDSSAYGATTPRLALRDGLERMQIQLSDQQIVSLLGYVQLLVKWNKVVNLTAVRDPLQMIHRHLLDSLSILEYIDAETLIDVGAGAGLPGIPLAIANPHVNVTLIDSVAKKTRFMQQVAAELRLANITALHQRVEQVNLQSDLVVARAFASIDKLALLTGHLLPTGGKLLAMVGQLPSTEQIEKIDGFSFVKAAKLTIPDETAERNIVILERDLT